MSKKQRLSYSDMTRLLFQMKANIEREKTRMGGVIMEAMIDDETASKLSNFSDAELRRLTALLAGHIDDCIATLEAEKRAKKKKENAAQPPAEQERIPLSALHEGAKDPAPSAASADPARTLSLPVRDSGYPS